MKKRRKRAKKCCGKDPFNAVTTENTTNHLVRPGGGQVGGDYGTEKQKRKYSPQNFLCEM
jgi:hypothetical protein